MEHAGTDDTADTDLVRRARRGDHAAFEALYRRHARAVHGFALRLCGDPAAAEDIVQDTFLKLFGFLGGFRDDAPLRPWLKRVASNLAIDRLRRLRPQLDAPLEEDAWADRGAGPDLHAEGEGLLRRLPPLVRTVVWLHEMEGWSHPELARRFGRSQSWSKSVLARGLARLRGELDDTLPAGTEADPDAHHDAARD